jgi:hypothetical protein
MTIEEYLNILWKANHGINPNLPYEKYKTQQLKKMKLDINDLEAVKEAEECLNLFIKAQAIATNQVIFNSATIIENKNDN